jgi:hypothetical protein
VQARLGARESRNFAAIAHAELSGVRSFAGQWLESAFTDVEEELLNFKKDVLNALSCPLHACIVRSTHLVDLKDPDLMRSYVTALTSFFGRVSDNNRFSEQSGVFVDMVQPTDPRGQDLTFRLGQCEPHSDESSKRLPEDIVILWCVRPADSGGASKIWTSTLLQAEMRLHQAGDQFLKILYEPEFLFGGRLRVPRRVLKAPILFGVDGIRFRLGTILDGHDVSRRPLLLRQQQALRALLAAIHEVEPCEYTLQPGEALFILNRRTLHARTSFSDCQRLLLRTRCFCDEISNSNFDQAQWLT